MKINYLIPFAAVVFTIGSLDAIAQEDVLSALDIVGNINAREDGEHVTRSLTLALTDRSGITRTQKTLGYRKYFDGEKRTVLFFTEPNNVRGTGFLTFDYLDNTLDDDQWLYLPALRKIRRISSSNRGDYFLGTDLTYEEMKKENKIETKDYFFSLQGKEMVGSNEVLVLEATPIDRAVANELGYSKVLLYVDPIIWISRKSEFWDLNGNRLKTVVNHTIEQIDSIWTTLRVEVENHKTQHKTVLTFSDVDYGTPIEDDIFSQPRLRRGLR